MSDALTSDASSSSSSSSTTTSSSIIDQTQNVDYQNNNPNNDNIIDPNSQQQQQTQTQGGGDVRTIFVSGWPSDIKQREVHNLFRFQPGFEVALLNNRGKVPVAFITFKEHENAVLAMSAFQGLRFEADVPSTDLRVELAKSTSFIPGTSGGRKRLNDDGTEASDDVDKRSRNFPSNPVRYQSSMNASGKHGTLYVVNIGPNVTEDELRETFAAQAGYRAIKVRPIRGGTAVVAWVDYATHEAAQSALEQLQGHRLPLGLGSPLKIDFANSPMNLNAIRENNIPGGPVNPISSSSHPSASNSQHHNRGDPYNQYSGMNPYYYPPSGYPAMFPPQPPMHSYQQPY